MTEVERAARRTSHNKRSKRYAGMMDDRNWQQTRVAQATSVYGCAWCAMTFRSPTAVYTHIDKRHPRR